MTLSHTSASQSAQPCRNIGKKKTTAHKHTRTAAVIGRFEAKLNLKNEKL